MFIVGKDLKWGYNVYYMILLWDVELIFFDLIFIYRIMKNKFILFCFMIVLWNLSYRKELSVFFRELYIV